MRRKVAVLLIVLAGLGGAGFLLRERTRASPDRGASAVEHAWGQGPQESPANDDRAARVRAPRSDARSKRNALREEIIRALERKETALAPGLASGARVRTGSPGSVPTSASARAAGKLANRLGDGKQALIDYMNEDFMPLAAECIEQAEERNPRLAGMLGIAVEIVADEALGGVIETAEPSLRNEVADAELVECVRQSALSVILPAPLVTGREQFEVTLRVGARPDGDAGPSP